MGTEGLKQALEDCVINFDRRVLLTDLLQEYELTYAEVDEILSAHIMQQEKKGAKFEKRFLVSGMELDTANEVYTVVQGETKLREWLRKLKNVESALYSVEIEGGAKSAADIFQPMKWCKNRIQMELREPLKWGASSNGSSNQSVKTEIKKEEKKSTGLNFAPKKQTEPPIVVAEKGNKKNSSPVKKATPESKQTTPEEKKSNAEKANNKKGIASFFSAAGSNTKSEAKKATGVIKPPTPKKLQDFFRKTDKTPVGEKTLMREEKPDKTNTSIQLFNTEDNEKESEDEKHTVVDVDTSDDEAQIEALRRECGSYDEDDEKPNTCSINKRRRIIDSDDEEPQVKHEKKGEQDLEIADSKETEVAGMSETYLDEDGFVVTVKPKKSAVSRKPALKKSPEKSPPKQEASKKTTKATPKATAKTKQGNIMSFFGKK